MAQQKIPEAFSVGETLRLLSAPERLNVDGGRLFTQYSSCVPVAPAMH